MKLYFSIAILFSLVIASGLGLVYAQSTTETTEPPFYPSECDDMPRETLEEKIEKRECRVAEAQRGVDYAPPSRVQLWIDELEKRQAGLDRLLEKQAAAAESTEPATTPVPEPTPEATPEPTPTMSQDDNAVIEALTAQLEALTTHIELLAMQLEELKSKMETMESTTVINQETDVLQQQYFDLDPLNAVSRGITTLNDKFYVLDDSTGVSYSSTLPDYKVYVYNADGTRDAASDFDLDLDYSSHIIGIAALNDKFWVLDIGRYVGVLAYNLDGTRDAASDFELNYHPYMSYAEGFTAHDGNLWILLGMSQAAIAYNTNGTEVSAYSIPNHSLLDPRGVTSYDGNLWVVGTTDDIVHVYNPAVITQHQSQSTPSLPYMSQVVSSDFVLDRFNGDPEGITTLNDKFYVVDSYDKRVYIYNADGTNPLQ